MFRVQLCPRKGEVHVRRKGFVVREMVSRRKKGDDGVRIQLVNMRQTVRDCRGRSVVIGLYQKTLFGDTS